MLRSFIAAAVLGALSIASSAAAQNAPQEEILNSPVSAAQPTPEGVPEWQAFSRSSQTAFLVDPSTITNSDGVTSIQVARAPLSPAPDEPAWTLETYEFRCASNAYRMTVMADFNLDGTPAGPAETLNETFDQVLTSGMSGHLKGVACDNQRVRPPHYASIGQWIAAGRK